MDAWRGRSEFHSDREEGEGARCRCGRWGFWLPCKLSLPRTFSTHSLRVVSTPTRSRSCLPGGLGLSFLAGSCLSCLWCLWWPLTMVVLLAPFALIFVFGSSADGTSSLPHHLCISHWVTMLILGRRIGIAYKRGSPVETFLSVMIWQRWVLHWESRLFHPAHVARSHWIGSLRTLTEP